MISPNISVLATLLVFSFTDFSEEPVTANPAIKPASKLENDFYNWEQRHEASPDVMPDALHPSNKGYGIWTEAIKPFVEAVK